MIRSILLTVFLAATIRAQCPDGSAGDPPVNGAFCPTGTTLTNGRCCSASSCVDKLNPNTGRSDCPNLTAYCSNSAYRSVMIDQCPKTCGFCNLVPTTTASTCFDKLNPNTGRSDCPNLTGYCNNSAYRQTMIDQCPKTCGFCR